jgi:glyoxylase-like metal-dependent hydrolase (beta-lactamase superfamily II)
MLPHDIGDFFPGLPHNDLVAAKARAGVQGTHFSIEQNCLVLRYPGHVVLFDTGMGTDPVYSWAQSGLLLRSMAAAGIDPAQVTEVVLTLAHSDHAWGLVDDAGAPNFPQAQVFVPPVDFEHWTDLTEGGAGWIYRRFRAGRAAGFAGL